MEQPERGKAKQLQDFYAELASFKLQLSLCKSRVAEMKDRLKSIRPKQA